MCLNSQFLPGSCMLRSRFLSSKSFSLQSFRRAVARLQRASLSHTCHGGGDGGLHKSRAQSQSKCLHRCEPSPSCRRLSSAALRPSASHLRCRRRVPGDTRWLDLGGSSEGHVGMYQMQRQIRMQVMHGWMVPRQAAKTKSGAVDQEPQLGFLGGGRR